uniref:Uncharacterized protein n=1 Tax=Plectus sambesii TaxID=2011161 RepID=A0A914WRQ8_9BILA
MVHIVSKTIGVRQKSLVSHCPCRFNRHRKLISSPPDPSTLPSSTLAVDPKVGSRRLQSRHVQVLTPISSNSPTSTTPVTPTSTPLPWPIDHPFQPTYLTRLLEQGANPNAVNSKGETPLILASKIKQVVAAQVLANNENTNLDFEDKDGKSAIMHAVAGNAPDIVNELVKSSRLRRHTQHLISCNRIGLLQRDRAKSSDTIELVENDLRRNSIDKPSPPIVVKHNTFMGHTNQPVMTAPRGWVGYRRELRKTLSKPKIESNSRVTDAVLTAQSVNMAKNRFISLLGVYKGRGRSIDKPESSIKNGTTKK